jgi:putative ABC transport system permease protein
VNIFKFAWRNANGSTFRSVVVFACAALMAGFAVAATVVIGGAQKSLELALDRLGADIIVVPAGSETLMENAFLMGVPARIWMPRDYTEQIAALPQVAAVSPQMFFSTLRGALCCSIPEMFLIAYEPETDFTLRPWLESHQVEGLEMGDAVGGAYVFVPVDPGYIEVYGFEVSLMGSLEQTGTGIDRSMFMTYETAQEIARRSPDNAVEELRIPDDSVSAIMVKVSQGENIHAAARQIEGVLDGVSAVESSNLFHTHRLQILGLLQSTLVLIGLAWLLSVALVGVVYSMAINERRQEIGVLRALGFSRPTVLESLLGEGLLLALAGGAAGAVAAVFAVYLFRNLIIQVLGVPFLIPSPAALLALSAAALALTLVSVTLGALLPSLRIVQMDPALAMRK